MDTEDIASGQVQGTSAADTEEMDIALSQASAGAESISSEQERTLLEPDREQGSQAKTNPSRVKLCGAGRRRLKAFLAKGIPLKTARSLAVKPYDATGLAQPDSKRGRSDSSTPPSASKQTKRFAPQNTATEGQSAPPQSPAEAVTLAPAASTACERMEVEATVTGHTNPGEAVSKGTAAEGEQTVPTPAPTLADTVRTTKVCIVPQDFPEAIWSTEQITAVQSCILDRVFEGRTGPVKPHFAGNRFMPGWLIINCLDIETVEWLKNTVPSLKPWEGAVLKVMDEADVPKARIFVGYFPGSASWQNPRILGQIEAQNTGLRVGEWRVLHRLQKGDLVELARRSQFHSIIPILVSI